MTELDKSADVDKLQKLSKDFDKSADDMGTPVREGLPPSAGTCRNDRRSPRGSLRGR
jgi:hypothetical protein